jgi:predicted nuclease of predicted toxin-antitoxin system
MNGVALLLDENLSEAILGRIRLTYPGSVHVRQAMGAGSSDSAVWTYAREHALVLVTRDADFERSSALHGAPPKVIWLAVHNLGNAEAIDLLERSRHAIARFVEDEVGALLVLGG